jgi:hypothetical protein
VELITIIRTYSSPIFVESGGYLASAELYDPSTGTFSLTGSMAASRNGQRATLWDDGKVPITGAIGEQSTQLRRVCARSTHSFSTLPVYGLHKIAN